MAKSILTSFTFSAGGNAINNNAAATVPLTIKGAASQSANLQSWQNSSSQERAYVTADGSILTAATLTTMGNLRVAGTAATGGGSGVIGIANAGTVPTTAPTGGGILYVETGALKYRGTSGSAATIVNADGTSPGGGGSFTGGTLTSGLVLATGTTTLQPLKFVAGTPGSNLLTTPVTGVKEYDGTVFYQTSDTNPGRALSTQDYYYLSNSQYFVDLSVGNTARSLLGANTRGITVAAGTTYDYEAMFAISASFILTSQTPTLAITSTTVSGSPSVSHFTILETGNNTAGFGTAITLGTTRITTTQNLTALTTGNRFYIIKMRGRINVTGTGTTKLYPSISANNGSSDNGWTVETGAMFKLTPLGNGTVTQVGTWA
jgi:hypothetical protein